MCASAEKTIEDSSTNIYNSLKPLPQYEEDIYLLRANISANSGKYKTALRQYEDYSKLVADVYGEHSRQYAKSLRHLAHINAFCKEYDTASDIGDLQRGQCFS